MPKSLLSKEKVNYFINQVILLMKIYSQKILSIDRSSKNIIDIEREDYK